MQLVDLFEYAQKDTRHVWSKRGKGVEKRVERKTSPAVKGRTSIAVKKDDHVE